MDGSGGTVRPDGGFHAPRVRREGPTGGGSLTFQQGADLGEGVYWPQTGVLPHSVLHKQQRDPTQKQHDKVRQEEGTCNRTMSSITSQDTTQVFHFYKNKSLQMVNGSIWFSLFSPKSKGSCTDTILRQKRR